MKQVWTLTRDRDSTSPENLLELGYSVSNEQLETSGLGQDARLTSEIRSDVRLHQKRGSREEDRRTTWVCSTTTARRDAGRAAARMAARGHRRPHGDPVRRGGRGLHRLSLAIARRRNQAGAQRRRDRGVDRRLVAGLGCDGLLAGGYGKRLLISGVHPTNAVSDISRSLPDNQSLLLRCCVDLDRSAVNTRSNAAETRRWARERGFKSLIVVTSNYHMPRAIVELSHAMPDVTLIPFAVVGDRWRDEPWWTSGATLRLLLSGIRQVCRRRGARAAGRRRHRSGARTHRSAGLGAAPAGDGVP